MQKFKHWSVQTEVDSRIHTIELLQYVGKLNTLSEIKNKLWVRVCWAGMKKKKMNWVMKIKKKIVKNDITEIELDTHENLLK